jgi:hypothetical protein
MERVMPKKILEVRSVKDIQMTEGLPLIVFMRDRNSITIYKIKNANGYVESWDDHLMPSYESLEEASKKFGEVALCRAKFPEKT